MSTTMAYTNGLVNVNRSYFLILGRLHLYEDGTCIILILQVVKTRLPQDEVTCSKLLSLKVAE